MESKLYFKNNNSHGYCNFITTETIHILCLMKMGITYQLLFCVRSFHVDLEPENSYNWSVTRHHRPGSGWMT